ncbi:MAG TPA: DoxX family protein [Candidatus Levybacteria bacterium]|nr:DoxX family protein [Candidatus Levybacteria bacterium]
MKIRNLPSDILQFGIAFVFIYAGIQIILNYQSFVGYAPEIIFDFIPVQIFMYGFAVFEIVLGLWLISGKKLLYSSLTAAGIMILINLFNLDLFIVLFRNIAILCGALALAAMSHRKGSKISITIDTSPEPEESQQPTSPTHQVTNPAVATHTNHNTQTPTSQPLPTQE